MKIAWYTPFSTKSAIGRFSQLVCSELLELGVDVTVVRSEHTAIAKNLDCLPFQSNVVWAHQLERDLVSQLGAFDMVAYNVGDHYDYHAYCFSHPRMMRGITILHDFILHHALNSYCHATSNQFGGYAEVVSRECGQKALDILSRCNVASPHDRWWQTEIARYPVFKWAMQSTLGVVTHARYYEDVVRNRMGCPTTVLPLAYDHAGQDTDSVRSDLSDQQKVVLLTVGSVNINKRHESIIQALAASSYLADRIQYRIVGPITVERRHQLQLLVDSMPIRLDVVMTGEVNRQQLQKEFATADIITCLRNPVLEGGSASVIEGMLTGKPLLVSQAGCYAEIPSQYVHAISIDNEQHDIQDALTDIVRKYPQAVRRASAGKVWAAQRHAPKKYAEGFVQFVDRVMFDRPVLEMVDRLAAKVIRWHSPPDSRLLNRLESAVAELFGEEVPSASRSKAA